LKTVLAGQIARSACIYNVDEIVVYDDKMGRSHESGWNSNEFMARIIQYMETPQYLRKHLIPLHHDLKFAGLLSPLDAPHHLRMDEPSPFREGVVVKESERRDKDALSKWVYIGLRKNIKIDRELPVGMRLTVHITKEAKGKFSKRRPTEGVPLPPSKLREEKGLYWGYATRVASSINDVFEKSPYEGGYDLTLGTSERGNVTVDDEKFDLPHFKHAMVVFGGVQGIEASIDNDEGMHLSGSEAHTLFNLWVNICPNQGSRTIRTEEAVSIALARLQPFFNAFTIREHK